MSHTPQKKYIKYIMMAKSFLQLIQQVDSTGRLVMETKVSYLVTFKDGVGELDYPFVMKHSAADVDIWCHSLLVPGVPRSKNQCLSMTCEASYYRDEAFEKKPNILAIFQLKSATKLHTFPVAPLPLTVSPQRITFRILDEKEKVKPIQALGLIQIHGYVRDKQIHI